MNDANAPRFERARSRNTASLLGMHSSSVTIQRRWLTAQGIEFQIGFGALLAGVERHAYFLPGAPPHVQDETSRGLAFELLAGRKVSRRIGFKGGLLFDFTGEESGGDVYAVGLVVIGL